MTQSEPVNPGSLRNRRNATRVESSHVPTELAGYIEIGMKKEALRLARAILEKKRITPEEFFQVIRAIGVYSDFNKWKADIRTAYDRQSERFKRQARSEMLDMYACLNEWEAAEQFVSIQRPSSVTDFVFGMDVLLELDRLEAAEALATRCKRTLSRTADPFQRSILLEALANFSARTHNWVNAIHFWRQVPLDQPLRQNALSGIVQLHLACAFECIELGLGKLAELKGHPDLETELCVPGNDLGLTLDAEKELLKFKRGIEKLLPGEARKELGIE